MGDETADDDDVIQLDMIPADEYRQRFLSELNRGYAVLREDAVAWQAEEAERLILEGTLMDGLDSDEVWADVDNAL